MDTKLKKYDNSFYRFLVKISPKGAKIVALILAGIFMGLSIMEATNLSKSQISGFSESNYKSSNEYHLSVMDMYEEMCITASVYLRNVDDNWDFNKSKYLLSDYLYYLDFNQYKYQKTDDGIIPVSDMFNYYVSFSDGDERKYLTNVQKINTGDYSEDEAIEELKETYSDYIVRRSNQVTSDKVSSSEIEYYNYNKADSISVYADYRYQETFPDNLVPIGSGCYDNYGRYFYFYGNEDAIIFYDFDQNDPDNYDLVNDIYSSTYTDDDGVLYSENSDLSDSPNYVSSDSDDSGITVFISPKADKVNELATAYNKEFEEYKNSRIMLIVFIPVELLLMIYLLLVCGISRDENDDIIVTKSHFLGKIYTEIYLAIAFVVLILMMFLSEGSLLDTFTEVFKSEIVAWLMCSLVSAGIYILGVGSLLEIVGKIKTKNFFIDCFGVKLIRKIINAYKNSEGYNNYLNLPIGQKLKKRSLIILIACGMVALSFLFCNVIGEVGLFFICSIIAMIVVIVCEYRNIRDYNELSKLSRQIKAIGNDEVFVETLDENSALYNDSNTLTQLSETVKNSVEEQIKSERMKIELVANVAHDLKTPLTSIISYIDLLEKLELDDEAKSYVKILDKKSQKLKSIVADVFSLAKVTSGIDVNLVKLDFVMLFNQVICDLGGKISSSGMNIKTTISEEEAFVMADGEKMYRVFQNIIDNALNYSLDGTRIFFYVYKKENNIIFSSKNTSSYPIDFTEEEIVERFVRGDKSRTDGGSGLGLSISKGFVEACGGEFSISIDGDLFKTEISMPLIQESENETGESIE